MVTPFVVWLMAAPRAWAQNSVRESVDKYMFGRLMARLGEASRTPKPADQLHAIVWDLRISPFYDEAKFGKEWRVAKTELTQESLQQLYAAIKPARFLDSFWG